MNTESKPAKKKTGKKLKTAFSKLAQRALAAVAASFVPVAVFYISHYEVQASPMLWVIAGSGLAYSLHSVVTWAKRWTTYTWKAISFGVLLEMVMVFSDSQVLALTGLFLLVSVNSLYAWGQALKKIS